eukprot:scaffold49502_cov39-Prasinocladus_malaysianus.AAC.1
MATTASGQGRREPPAVTIANRIEEEHFFRGHSLVVQSNKLLPPKVLLALAIVAIESTLDGVPLGQAQLMLSSLLHPDGEPNRPNQDYRKLSALLQLAAEGAAADIPRHWLDCKGPAATYVVPQRGTFSIPIGRISMAPWVSRPGQSGPLSYSPADSS